VCEFSRHNLNDCCFCASNKTGSLMLLYGADMASVRERARERRTTNQMRIFRS
jgi:hypothetical protein